MVGNVRFSLLLEASAEDHTSSICNPQFSFRLNQEKGLDISLLHSLVQPFFCRNCKKLLTTRNRYLFWNSITLRVFTQHWDHSQDVDEFSNLPSILFSSEDTASFSPPNPSTQDAVGSFVSFVCSLGDKQYSLRQLHQLREEVVRFVTCCEKWCNCDLSESELACDCCGWIKQQGQAKQASLVCPECHGVVGRLSLPTEAYTLCEDSV